MDIFSRLHKFALRFRHIWIWLKVQRGSQLETNKQTHHQNARNNHVNTQGVKLKVISLLKYKATVLCIGDCQGLRKNLTVVPGTLSYSDIFCVYFNTQIDIVRNLLTLPLSFSLQPCMQFAFPKCLPHILSPKNLLYAGKYSLVRIWVSVMYCPSYRAVRTALVVTLYYPSVSTANTQKTIKNFI
jgi:hypothetical protein